MASTSHMERPVRTLRSAWFLAGAELLLASAGGIWWAWDADRLSALMRTTQRGQALDDVLRGPGYCYPSELSGSVLSVKLHGKIREDVAVGFIINNLSNRSLRALLDEERLRAFRDLVADGKTIAAAEEYQSVTGADIPECHLAVEVTVACNRASTAN